MNETESVILYETCLQSYFCEIITLYVHMHVYIYAHEAQEIDTISNQASDVHELNCCHFFYHRFKNLLSALQLQNHWMTILPSIILKKCIVEYKWI